MNRLYLDAASIAPLDERVAAVMTPWLRGAWNPSSPHAEGRRARAEVDRIRARLGTVFGVPARELVFTASGSESIALAILGRAALGPPGRIFASAAEHAAVLGCVRRLVELGWEHTAIPVAGDGAPRPDALERLLATADDGRPCIVSCMLVNNELGTITDVAAIATITRRHGAFFHCDAIAAGDSADLAPAFLANATSLAAHKCGGPPAGVLRLRDGAAVAATVPGGPQEGGRRAGTENVAVIAGAGEAFALRESERAERSARTSELRERFATLFRMRFHPDLARLTVDGAPCVSTIVHTVFRGLDGPALLAGLDLAGVAVSAGSACAAGALERSHVLDAIGLPAEWSGAVRWSWTARVSASDIERAIVVLGDIVTRVGLAEGETASHDPHLPYL